MQPGLARIEEQLREAFHAGDARAGDKATEAAHVRCLAAFYGAIGRGDFEAALASLADAPSFAMYAGGPQPFRMSGRGRVEVADGIRRNFGVITFERVDIESLVAQGDLVLVVLRQRGHWRHNGEEFDDRGVLEFGFAEGRIAHYRGFMMPFLG